MHNYNYLGQVQYVNSQLKNSEDGKDFIDHQYSVVRDHGRGMITIKVGLVGQIYGIYGSV